MPQPLKETKFICSASNVKQLGLAYAEVAFVGRSNVGKSSLLNALCFQRGLAKTSKTPGRTRLINVFDAGDDRWIVDLPGYGFALCPEHERKSWQAMIEGYLINRKSLCMVYVLIDAEVGPTKLDHQMAFWLSSVNIAYRIVATKCDQVKASQQLNRRQSIASSLNLHSSDIAWVSAVKGLGVPNLRLEIAKILSLVG